MSFDLNQAHAIQLERDITVWNTKTFHKKPLLLKEDHLILAYRRWYSQFYSEKTIYSEQDKDSLDW